MNDRDLYLERRKLEEAKFQRVFAAIPKGKLDYKPHKRSPSAAQIMWTVAASHAALCDLVEKGRADWEPAPGFTAHSAEPPFDQPSLRGYPRDRREHHRDHNIDGRRASRSSPPQPPARSGQGERAVPACRARARRTRPTRTAPRRERAISGTHTVCRTGL